MTESPRNSSSAADCGPDCAAVLQRLWEFLDGELGPEDTAAFHAHLSLCNKCYPQYNFEKTFLDALAACQCEKCAPYELRCKVASALKSAGFTPVQPLA
ncbi:MAG TPA: zf-HC2 domain-containing protein [Gemmatimonadaceae bacterium]|jgi:anti-sigma factor (TIGR02949 family)|nr:zf-HC2 domain-containing protein [Gemmatimonadaceae bacterium]